VGENPDVDRLLALATRLPARLRHPVYRRLFAKSGPWVTGFEVDGRSYGGPHPFSEDVRLAEFWAAFPDARKILELGSLEGGHTLALARRAGTHVTAVEGRSENLVRARIAQRLLGVHNVEFSEADLDSTPLLSLGRFDAVFCCGLLYHLTRPWDLVDAFRSVAPGVFLWTHYCAEAKVDAELDGSPGCWYGELGRADPLSGLSAQSFWPTLPALVDRLRAAGFANVETIRDEPDHPHGPTITLAASSEGA
jgi:SAM-dependent methyltransferase